MSKTGTDIDIYEDIGDFNFEKELRKLEERNKAYSQEVSELSQKLKEVTDKNEELQRVNDILTTNISVLLKTAKVEIDRKQLVIASYREDIENLKKRNNYRKDETQNSGLLESEVFNDKKKHIQNYDKHGNEENSQHYFMGVCKNKTKSRSKSHDRESSREHSGRHKARKSRRERSRSRSKFKKTSSEGQSKHSEKSYSHSSSSSRSDHKHHSDDRRHRDSHKRKHSSSRSDRRRSPRSRRSGSRHRKDDVRRDSRWSSRGRRSISPKNAAKTPERSEILKTGNSELRGGGETELSTRRQSSDVKDCHTKDLNEGGKEEEASNPVPDRKEDSSETRSKEKCDTHVKKLTLSEYQERQSIDMGHKKRSETTPLFTRQSVLSELYDQPMTVNRFAKASREIQEKQSTQPPTVSVCNVEDSSSDDGWNSCFGQKSNTVKKPKTLYTRRMEARLQQKMQQEESAQQQLPDNVVEGSRDVYTSTEDRENRDGQKTDLNNVKEDSQKEYVNVEVRKERRSPESDLVPVVSDEKELEEGEIVDDMDDTVTESAENTVNKEINIRQDNGEENTGKEPVNGKEKVSSTSQIVEGNKKGVETASDNTEEKPVFCESLSKDSFQSERAQETEDKRDGGIQVFTPLKNSYKVLEISPIKPVQKQHILEYYNLKPSPHQQQQQQNQQQQQLKTTELEGLNFSFPQTPGKNFSNSFSIISDFQVLTSGLCSDSLDKGKEEKCVADPVEVENDKSEAEALNQNCHSAEGDTEGVSESPESVNNGKKRVSCLNRRRSARKSCRGRDEGDDKCSTKSEMLMNPRVELVDNTQSKPGVRKSKRTSVRADDKREEEQTYQLRTRSQSKATEESAKKAHGNAVKGDGSTRRRTACKSEYTRRKRKAVSSDDGDGSQGDEDEAFLPVGTKRTKTDQRDLVDDGKLSTEKTPSPIKKIKTEEKETGSGCVPDNIPSFQVLQSLPSVVTETPQAELITATTGLDDLSLSNSGDGQLLGFSSTVITSGASLHDDGVLETPMKVLPPQAAVIMSSPVEATEPNEALVADTAETEDGHSLNSSFVLRKYLMMSNNEEFSGGSSEDSDRMSVDSDEYSDSGASAFVDLL